MDDDGLGMAVETCCVFAEEVNVFVTIGIVECASAGFGDVDGERVVIEDSSGVAAGQDFCCPGIELFAGGIAGDVFGL